MKEESIYYENVNIESQSSHIPRYCRIMAFNGFSWSEPALSIPSSIIPSIQPPGQVLNPIAYASSSIGIIAKWSLPSIDEFVYGGDGGSPITHYVVEWDTKPDFSSPAESAIVMANLTSFQVGGRDSVTGAESDILTPGGIFYLRVTAFNNIGSGPATLLRHPV